MHMKHVPLNCTENHCAYYKSCISLTVQHVTVILFLGEREQDSLSISESGV